MPILDWYGPLHTYRSWGDSLVFETSQGIQRSGRRCQGIRKVVTEEFFWFRQACQNANWLKRLGTRSHANKKNITQNLCLLKAIPFTSLPLYLSSTSPLSSISYASCCHRYPAISPVSRKSTTMTGPTTTKAYCMGYCQPTGFSSHCG